MIPFARNIQNEANPWRRQIRKGWTGRGENRITADWCRVSMWAEENVLEPENGNDCIS